MSNLSNYEIAQAISERIGAEPIPFDSVYSIVLKIYNELGGDATQFDSVYSILLEILPLAVYAKDSVIDVDTLPNAELIKNKLVRYEGNLYYAKPEEIKAVKFTALEDGSSVGLTALSSNQTLEYSIDDETWSKFDTTTSIPLNNGEGVFVRGILSDNNTNSNYTQFAINGKVVAKGNINTLFDYTAEDLGSAFQLKQYCGYKLFYNCEGLIDVKELYLPSTLSASSCYQNMFNGCTNLTSVQEILPLNLGGAAAALACSYMYSKTAIEVAPVILSTSIENSAVEYMFQSAPKTVAPLKYIKCLATSIGVGATKYWVRGVQTESGTFVKASTMNDWTTGISGIPEGWTVVNDDTVPEYHWNNSTIYKWTQIANGYVYNEAKGSFAIKYRQDEEDGGQELVNIATGYGAHAEGYNTQATGDYGSHAEGYNTQATYKGAHAEGYKTVASGLESHAEGCQTQATGRFTHSEGYQTKATGEYGAHAEGYQSEANEQVSHAEGRSIVNGRYGHGEGYKTEVKNYAEHAQGRLNVSHTDEEGTQIQDNPKRTIHTIGIGTKDSNRLNAVEIMTNGDYYVRGIGGYDGVHIKYETGYENTKTLQEAITSLEARIDDNVITTNKTWSSNKIAAELANAGFSVQIVQELPVSGDTHTIYFVPETGGETGDAYDEYMYVDNTWEKIGSTRIDLSEYAKKLDYFIPINFQTKEIGWTVLNSAVNGVYRVAMGIEMAGQRMIMQQGVMTNVLLGNERKQTIVFAPLEPSTQGSPFQVHYRVTDKEGTQWYEYDYNIGIINDGVLSNPSTATDKVYSRAKVDDLLNNKQDVLTAGTGISISGDTISCTLQEAITSLEARIAALEGNSTV